MNAMPTIVVTGAGRGLGRAISIRLVRSGYAVWVAELREDWAAETVAQLEELGGHAAAVPVDLRDAKSVTAMAHHVADHGPVHGLVNNAARADGVGGRPVHEIPTDQWDEVLGVNVRGTFLVTKAIAPLLISAGGGSIVNIGSDAAANGSANLGHYITSKGAISAFTRACATDLGPFGITVNTVSPGLTVSESAALVPEHRHEEYRRQRSLARDQQPEDLVGAVAFCLGPEARYITGQELLVNGGFVFR